MNTPVAIDDMRKGISSKELEQQRTEQKKNKTNKQTKTKKRTEVKVLEKSL